MPHRRIGTDRGVDTDMSQPAHSSLGRRLLHGGLSRRACTDPIVDHRRFARRHVLHRERHHRHQSSALATHDRPTRSVRYIHLCARCISIILKSTNEKKKRENS